ncbi:hypothetical protein DFH06DRAFT_285269 [Mycena polygramma]|nr:hypothetical protein DFH06DRAFT_285269 [Mycena polygramma]
MHDCLRIPDLLDQIFSHFTTGYDGDGKVLAKLGRTCWAFHDPAMDVLWKDPDDLINILRCMPSDLFAIDTNPAECKRTLRLLRPIMPRDWDRALLYLPRVKRFRFPSMGALASFSEILPALRQSLPTRCFFPNLLTLRWYPREGEANFLDMDLFTSPTITSVAICGMPPSCTSALLSALSLKCQTLTEVEISLSGNAFRNLEDGLCPSVSAFIHQLPVVERLSMLLPDAASLEHVGQIDTLRFMYLPTLPDHVLPPVIRGPLSLNLSELIVGVLDIENATKLIGMCPDTMFGSLRFTFDKCSSQNIVGKFFTALIQCRRSHASLRSLGLRNIANDEPELVQELFLLPNHRLTQLFSFGNLTKIEIESPCGFELDDRICAEMARAWPRLECLTLREYYKPVKQLVTLESFRSFAQHCPALHKLRITFDARVVPRSQPSANSSTHQSQSTLEHLHVGYSLIEYWDTHPRAVARFIGALFPNLTYIEEERERDYDLYDEALEDGNDYWVEVQDLLPRHKRLFG